MSLYKWGKRIRVDFSYKNKKISKIRIKTNTADWIDTHEPVIVPFSIHSNFHAGDLGALQVKTMLKTLKAHIKGPITILLTEKAHIHALSLSHNGDAQKALAQCIADANILRDRFVQDFQGCTVITMDALIAADPDYQHYRDRLMNIYQTDAQFQELIRADAIGTYTPARAQEIPDKELFVTKTIEDLLEQCIILFIASKLGYRFECYTGKPNPCSEYINRNFIPHEKQITRVVVDITKEK